MLKYKNMIADGPISSPMSGLWKTTDPYKWPTKEQLAVRKKLGLLTERDRSTLGEWVFDGAKK